MDPEERRVIEIWSGRQVGSGYLVSDRHVLTARHVLELQDRQLVKQCQVRCLGQRCWVAAKLDWDSDDLDLALLTITDVGWEKPRVEPVRWGWVLGAHAIPCTAVGFPDAQARADTVRDTEQVGGVIEPLTTSKAKQLGITVTSTPPVDRGPGRTWWSGISGAAVFAEKALVGVVVSTPNLFGAQRLKATRVSEAVQQQGLAEELARAGVELHLEPLPSVRGLQFPWQLLSRRGLGSPSVLLRADRAVVPFRRREREQVELQRWCLEERSPLRLVVGSAGAGKTRLALELTEQMANQGWLTGFIDQAGNNAIEQLEAWGQPVLLVVDYAETRSNLRELLRPLARPGAARRPLRLILLARAAGDWWRELQRDSALQGLASDEEPYPLAPVDERTTDRAVAFTEAATAFAAAQGMELKPLVLPDLSGNPYEAILHVHMAALDAVGTPDEPGPGLAARGELPALAATLRREEGYWTRSAGARGLRYSDRVLGRAVMMATLIGATDEDEAATLLRRVPDLADASEAEIREVAWWDHFLYPGTEWLGGLQPDALAEELVAETLASYRTLTRTAFRNLAPTRAQQALTILDRTARRRPEMEPALEEILSSDLEGLAPSAIAVAMQTGDPIGKALANVLAETPAAPPVLAHLHDAIPERTVSLREAAVLFARAAVDNARREGPQSRVARSLNLLALRLLGVGQSEEALEAIQQAVHAYRELLAPPTNLFRRSPAFIKHLWGAWRNDTPANRRAGAASPSALGASEPEDFQAGLAEALNILSNTFSSLGQREAALEAMQEAVKVFRGLASARVGVYGPDFTAALSNLSGRLSELGRHEDALAVADQAVRIWRELASARPDAFRPDLAMALNNFSMMQANLGRYEDALATIEEAVLVFRELIAARSDAYRPALASALTNLSVSLAEVGHHGDAMTAADESVVIWRDLASARPDAFRPDLAGALNNLANRQSNLGDYEDALATAEEAVVAFRQLAAARPDAYQGRLALALTNLSRRLSELGRHEDALAVACEAVPMLRELARMLPDSFRPDLAAALDSLSNRLSNLGQLNDALSATREAVAVYHELAANQPDTFCPQLASSLSKLSNMAFAAGLVGDAMDPSREAVNLYRHLAGARPEVFRPDLASSLGNQSRVLSNLGQHDEALVAIEEALAIHRDLVGARPDDFRGDLASSLGNRSTVLSNLGRHDDALVDIQEAVAIFRELAGTRPGAFRADLAMSLKNLSVMLSDISRREDALVAIDEAVHIYRELAATRPDAFRPALASSLDDWSGMLSKLGDHDGALVAIQEAVDLYRELAAARPDAFRPNLALTLDNLSGTLSDAGRREDALVAVQEAVDIYRQLAAARPDPFVRDLASALKNLSLRLADMGRQADAMAAIQEALAQVRQYSPLV